MTTFLPVLGLVDILNAVLPGELLAGVDWLRGNEANITRENKPNITTFQSDHSGKNLKLRRTPVRVTSVCRHHRGPIHTGTVTKNTEPSLPKYLRKCVTLLEWKLSNFKRHISEKIFVSVCLRLSVSLITRHDISQKTISLEWLKHLLRTEKYFPFLIKLNLI